MDGGDRWSVYRNFFSFARRNASSDEQNKRAEDVARANWTARTNRQFGALLQQVESGQDDDATE